MLVRVDDFPYSGTKENQPHNWHDDYKEKALQWIIPFEENKVNYIFGVSPLLFNDGDVEFLNEHVKYGKVVMHGFSHGFELWEAVNDITDTWQDGGEFSNLSFEEIKEKYNECNDILQKIESYDESHFIPPFNAINQKILDVLLETNVKYIHIASDFWNKYSEQMNYDFYDMECIIAKSDVEYAPINVVMNNIHTIENPTLHWLFDTHNNKIHHYGDFAKMIKDNKFWHIHPDREYMKNVLYPEIGNDENIKTVLDVGVQDYNKNNKKLLGNDDIEYWQIDDFSDTHGIEYSNNIEELSCDRFVNVSMIDLPDKNPETLNYFDCIISIGVIGFYKFPSDMVDGYIQSVHRCLKSNGVFYLHYAGNPIDYNINSDKILESFDVEREDRAGQFTFLKLRKLHVLQ